MDSAFTTKQAVSRADLTGTPAANDPDEQWSERFERDLDYLWDEYVAACVEGRRNELSPVVKSMFDEDMQRLYQRARTPAAEGFIFGGCCVPGVQKLHVTTDGLYQVCERVVDDLIIGDVNVGIDEQLIRAVHDRYVSQFDERCANCWAVRLCRLCYSSVREKRNSGSVHEQYCHSIKKHLGKSLKAYVRIMESGAKTPDFLLINHVEK